MRIITPCNEGKLLAPLRSSNNLPISSFLDARNSVLLRIIFREPSDIEHPMQGLNSPSNLAPRALAILSPRSEKLKGSDNARNGNIKQIGDAADGSPWARTVKISGMYSL